MKRKIALILAMMLVLVPFSFGLSKMDGSKIPSRADVFASPTESEMILVVSKVTLNVRSGPSTSTSVIGQLKSGESAPFVAQSNGWYKIVFGAQEGFVSSNLDYTYILSQSQNQQVTAKTGLNLRSGAGTSYRVVGTLSKGESVPFIAKVGNWYEVRFQGKAAYISANPDYSYLAGSSSPSPTATSAPSQTPKPSTSPTPTSSPLPETVGQVEASVVLNIRSAPSTSSAILGKMQIGDKLAYVESVSSFHKVIHQGRVAYVSSNPSYTKVLSDNQGDEEDTEKNGTVIVKGYGVNVRSGPSTSYGVLSVANFGDNFKFLGESGNWYKIDILGRTGYISKDYSYFTENGSDDDSPSQPQPPLEGRDSLILSNVDDLNVRSSPSAYGTIVGEMNKGDMLPYLGKEGDFYLTTHKGKPAYVSAKSIYTSISYLNFGSAKVEKIITQAERTLGTPYVLGAQRLHFGNGNLNPSFTGKSFDCSSLTQYAYYVENILLGTTTRSQVLQGRDVSKTSIKRGDLLFFTNADRFHNQGIERIGHVAIYLGDNYILHTSSDYAVIEQISAKRWSYFIAARDVI